MRNGLHRGGQPLRDGAAHAVMRHDLIAAVFVERADLQVGHRRRDCRSGAGYRRRAKSAAFLSLRHVAGDDAAVRTGALDAAESMLASFASRRASGEAKTRLAAAPCPLARSPSPPPSPRWGEGARGAGGGGGAFASFETDAGAIAGAAACWAAPSPRGGEGGDERAPPLVALAPAAAAFTSSPSSAKTAMSWLTGTSLVPSGTTIFASVPSSMASYSIVALSVSISAMTSPVSTASPSFLSHLARLPFSIVGDSAGSGY